MTPEQITQVIAEYDRLVRANGTMREVADDDLGEVGWEVLDVVQRLFAFDVDDEDQQRLDVAVDAYRQRLREELA